MRVRSHHGPVQQKRECDARSGELRERDAEKDHAAEHEVHADRAGRRCRPARSRRARRGAGILGAGSRRGCSSVVTDSALRPGNTLGRQHLFDPPTDHTTLLHPKDRTGEPAKHVGVMGHEQDRQPVITVEPAQDVHDRRRRFGVHAGRRLVEEEEAWLCGKGPRYQHSLNLASRERSETLVGEGTEPHQLETPGREEPLGSPDSPERTAVGRRFPSARPLPRSTGRSGSSVSRCGTYPNGLVARSNPYSSVPARTGMSPTIPRSSVVFPLRLVRGAPRTRRLTKFEIHVLEDRSVRVAEADVPEYQKQASVICSLKAHSTTNLA